MLQYYNMEIRNAGSHKLFIKPASVFITRTLYWAKHSVFADILINYFFSVGNFFKCLILTMVGLNKIFRNVFWTHQIIGSYLVLLFMGFKIINELLTTIELTTNFLIFTNINNLIKIGCYNTPLPLNIW